MAGDRTYSGVGLDRLPQDADTWELEELRARERAEQRREAEAEKGQAAAVAEINARRPKPAQRADVRRPLDLEADDPTDGYWRTAAERMNGVI